MLKWLIRGRLAKFEKSFDYDVSYLRDVLDADTGAFLKFARLIGVSEYRKNVPFEAWYAARLIGSLAEDCGPCTQLVVTMAERAGVATTMLTAVLVGNEAAMSDDVRLAVQFARAVLTHDPAAHPLRAEVLRHWSARGLVSLGFGIVSSRLYPTLKYALGHGHACQRVLVAGTPVAVARAQV